MLKPEFPALLSPGIHTFQVEDLADFFVTKFPYSIRRPMLLAGLLKFIQDAKALGMSGELWFDGSFATEKQDPDDVDLVVIYDPVCLQDLSLEREQRIGYLLHQPSAKAAYNCDVYCASRDDSPMVSYWRGWYGFKRDGKTAKGIGCVTL